MLKDDLNIGDNDLKEGDTVYIILKENYGTDTKRKEEKSERSARKESKSDKKKNEKHELAPMSDLPTINKYKITPDILQIIRMTRTN